MMYNSYESRTSLGIAERWERVLCYALGWISGIVMLIVERENRNVRRHATQSMLVFGGLNILAFVVGLIGGVFGHIPLIGFLFAFAFGAVGWIIGAVALVLWLLLLLMAYARPNFFLPLGRAYERLLGQAH
ncbi:MAG TPA: hypothetical protein VGN32_05630 [Ktedonobacterales bacterium]|jgi:uncharacterized membrane protein|nr:hypothetical protein [Ktedonobacterales bacterium]